MLVIESYINEEKRPKKSKKEKLVDVAKRVKSIKDAYDECIARKKVDTEIADWESKYGKNKDKPKAEPKPFTGSYKMDSNDGKVILADYGRGIPYRYVAPNEKEAKEVFTTLKKLLKETNKGFGSVFLRILGLAGVVKAETSTSSASLSKILSSYYMGDTNKIVEALANCMLDESVMEKLNNTTDVKDINEYLSSLLVESAKELTEKDYDELEQEV